MLSLGAPTKRGQVQFGFPFRSPPSHFCLQLVARAPRPCCGKKRNEVQMVYCTDVDLLHWEPNILRDALFASQLLLSGTGSLAGTTFTLASGSLSSAHIVPDEVVVLSGALAGSFPIVSVNSATQLTLSVLYDGLFPDSGSAVATPAGTAADLGFAVRTFWPQRRVVSDL